MLQEPQIVYVTHLDVGNINIKRNKAIPDADSEILLWSSFCENIVNLAPLYWSKSANNDDQNSR